MQRAHNMNTFGGNTFCDNSLSSILSAKTSVVRYERMLSSMISLASIWKITAKNITGECCAGNQCTDQKRKIIHS